ncbi:MAG: hypothetical protein WB660_07810 [Candidatus Sulfotelmatobacter sp.]
MPCGFCDDYDYRPMTGRNWLHFFAIRTPRLPPGRAQSRWPLPMNTEKKRAIRRLIEILPAADWLVQGEIESWLEEHLDIAQTSIDEEIERRRTVPAAGQFKDDILRLLLAIKSKVRKFRPDAR